jgi:hypothetical protein
MIDGTPQVHVLAGDPHDHFVEVPSLARAWAPPPQVSRNHGPEFQHPTPHRLVRDVKPMFRQQILNVAVAQGETEIQPNRVLDERRREAMSAIREMGHVASLPDHIVRSNLVSVTMPTKAAQASYGTAITVATSAVCYCDNTAATSPTAPSSVSCAGSCSSGQFEQFLSVTVSQSVTLLFSLPYLSSPRTLSATGQVRTA